MRKVVLVDDDPIIRMDLADILSREGFEIAGQGSDGFDAVQLCESFRPHLVLMDIKMPVFDGLDAARDIIAKNLADCIVLLSAFSDEEFIARAKDLGVAGYLVKPVDEKTLLPAIEIAMAQSERIRKMTGETESIRLLLEEKRIQDRAKAILAKREGISESEAYARIQKMAMDKSMPMAAVARRLVESMGDRDEVDAAKNVLMGRYNIGESAAFRRIQKYSRENGCGLAEAAKRIVAAHTK